MVRDTMQVAQYSTGFSVRSFPTVATPIRFRPSCFSAQLSVQRACARIHTHVRKRVDGLFVSRELENAFQRISRDASVLETRLFVEKREFLCYGFYTLSAPVSFEFVSTELCTSFSLDVGILMTERGLILFSFCSTIRFVDYLEINYKLNYYLENARCIIGNNISILKEGESIVR